MLCSRSMNVALTFKNHFHFILALKKIVFKLFHFPFTPSVKKVKKHFFLLLELGLFKMLNNFLQTKRIIRWKRLPVRKRAREKHTYRLIQVKL